MGRVFKIVMYLVLLLLVYLWFSTIFKSCGKGKGAATANIENIDDGSLDDLDALDDEYADSDEFFEEEDDVDYEKLDADVDTEDQDIYDEDIDYTSDEKISKPSTTSKPVQSSTPVQPSQPAPRSTSSGKYMVIAGSYLIKSNAESMRNKLSNLGYDAEVVIFDLSEYHSVSAGKFRSYEDAQSASRKLSGRGIDSYVHTKK